MYGINELLNTIVNEYYDLYNKILKKPQFVYKINLITDGDYVKMEEGKYKKIFYASKKKMHIVDNKIFVEELV